MKIVSGRIFGARKVVLYGPEGIGKSTMASRFPKPLFIDTEGSTKDMEVDRTPKPTSWTMLLEYVRSFKANPDPYRTLVIDTADWAEQLCITELCAKSQKTGIEDFGYGKGYVYLSEEFGKLLNLLEDVVVGGAHVVLTAHAWMRRFEQPDEMGGYDRWEMKMGKKTAPLVKEWADEVFFANYKTMVVNVDGQGVQKGKNKVQGGRRVMYATHHPCWDAKNRLKLPDELPFEYSEVARFYDSNATTPPAAPAVPAAPPAPTDATAPVPPEEHKPSESTLQARPETPTKRESDQSALAALRDLMSQNNVLDADIQAAVAARGYFPEETPLDSFPPDFIRGVLIAAWPQVHQWIMDNRPLPF